MGGSSSKNVKKGKPTAHGGGGSEGKADDGSGGGIPLEVEIVLGAHTGMNIQCDGSNHAKCNNANTGGWERVKIKQRGSSYILTSMKSGNNLQCQKDGKCAFANTNELLWEQWAIETKGDALYFVSRHTNKVMQCTREGAIRCANENRLGYETFRVVWREGGGGAGGGGAGGGLTTTKGNWIVEAVAGQPEQICLRNAYWREKGEDGRLYAANYAGADSFTRAVLMSKPAGHLTSTKCDWSLMLL